MLLAMILEVINLVNLQKEIWQPMHEAAHKNDEIIFIYFGVCVMYVCVC